jgi:hypothetical protein
MEVNGQLHSPAALPPGKEAPVPLDDDDDDDDNGSLRFCESGYVNQIKGDKKLMFFRNHHLLPLHHF